ncbi:hypothetical protein FSP39_009412 [Pinctada imbricata]|uniref:Uncharacterized protein n=1 Tax=Pinctada imbricata TaxID=66713 RepID=A0AA89BHH4_PINIB|nr:hypothetical protein FSP39_009412 [Pinctada imbricata]
MEPKDKLKVVEDGSVSSSSEEIEREKWGRKAEYMLSMLGYCVGLGNLWRFPYLCMKMGERRITKSTPGVSYSEEYGKNVLVSINNAIMEAGPGAFLIPFLFVLLACGLPLYFLEVSLGQFTGKGAAQVWEVCPIFKGIGIGMIVVLCVSGLYYNIIVAWTLHYLGSSFINPLPWTDCNNNWNTGDCIRNEVRDVIRNTSVYNSSDVGSYLNGSIYNVTGGNSSVERYVVQVGSISPEEDYWQYVNFHFLV